MHDNGLFQTFTCVVFNVDADHLINSFVEFYDKQGCKAAILSSDADISSLRGHAIRFVTSEKEGFLWDESPYLIWMWEHYRAFR